MPVTEMIVGMSAGAFMLLAFVYTLRLIQAWMLHRTLRDAIKRDSALAPHLVDKIGGGPSPADGEQLNGDDRSGMVLIAVGVALIGFALIVNDAEWLRYGLGAALFPIMVGAALLGRHIWLRRILERRVDTGR